MRKSELKDSEPKYMSITQFRELGFLQEANRLFFHSLGLALVVNQDENGNEVLQGIWDYREDPEGIIYGLNSGVGSSSPSALEKKQRVHAEWVKHKDVRMCMFGSSIQPLEPPLVPIPDKEV